MKVQDLEIDFIFFLVESGNLFFVHAVNWCQHWFEYFPNPPINMLGLVENVLAHHDKEVLTHLVQQGVTSQVKINKPFAIELFSVESPVKSIPPLAKLNNHNDHAL